MKRDPIESLRRYARHLEAEVPTEDARARIAPMLRRPLPPSPRRRRMVALAVAVLLISNLALAGLADEAAPGDILYGVDRAYERIAYSLGLVGPPGIERLEEADRVLDRGQAQTALSLTREAIEEISDARHDLGEAHEALLEVEEAHKALLAVDEAPSAFDNQALATELRDLVAAARSYAESQDAHGHTVAEAARKLRDTVFASLPASPPGPPEGVPPEQGDENGVEGTDEPGPPPIDPPGPVDLGS